MRDNRKRYLERREQNKTHSTSAPKKIELPKHDNMGVFISLMVISFFVALIYISIVSSSFMDIGFWEIIRLYCLLFAIGLCIPIKIYRKKFTMSYYEYVLFNFLSFPLVMIAFAFLLNNNIRGKSYIETYAVTNFRYDSQSRSMIYELEDQTYDEKEHLRTIQSIDFHKIKGQTEFSLYFSDGLFGIRLIENKVVN